MRSVYSCPICQASVVRSQLSVVANADGRLANGYRVLTCARCDTAYTFPRPDEDALTQSYARGIYRDPEGGRFFLIDAALNWLQEMRLREIGHFKIGGDLLDVGCGKGRFLASARRRGWKVYGVETSPGQIAQARVRYDLQVFRGGLPDIGLPDGTCDIVTAWHVLEHVSDPAAALAEIRRILRSDGVFVMEVPNFASLQSRLGRELWFHLDVPRHLLHFSPTSLERLLREQGFQIVERRFLSPELGLYGMLQTLINRTGLPPNWLFRWLKKSLSKAESSAGLAFVNFGAAALLLMPALVVEIAAVVMDSGGVLRLLAIKREV